MLGERAEISDPFLSSFERSFQVNTKIGRLLDENKKQKKRESSVYFWPFLHQQLQQFCALLTLFCSLTRTCSRKLQQEKSSVANKKMAGMAELGTFLPNTRLQNAILGCRLGQRKTFS